MRFIHNYGVITKPLAILLQKDKFPWTETDTAAYNTLKQAMMRIPTLVLPDFYQQFIVKMDACHSGVGTVLLKGKPLPFLSKALPPKLGLSTCKKELRAIIFAINKLHYYLYGRPFVISTDHNSLKFLLVNGYLHCFNRNGSPSCRIITALSHTKK